MIKKLAMIALLAISCFGGELPNAPVKKPVVDKKFVLFTAMAGAATAADAKSTADALGKHCQPNGSCYAVVEANPFFGSNPSNGRIAGESLAIYATQVFLSYEMKKHHSKLWMLPLGIATGAHTFAAVHNEGIQ